MIEEFYRSSPLLDPFAWLWASPARGSPMRFVTLFYIKKNPK